MTCVVPRLTVLASHTLRNERLIIRIPTLANLPRVFPIVDSQESLASRARALVAVVWGAWVASPDVVLVTWVCPCYFGNVDGIALDTVAESSFEQAIGLFVL